MRKIGKAVLVVTCLIVGAASAVYAASETVTGGFNGGPGSTDKFDLKCSKGGKISAQVSDDGPNFDNVFGVAVLCKTGDSAIEIAPAGGKSAKATVNDCDKADIFVFCDVSSTFCDDAYSAKLKCKGDIIDLFQEQDE
ncbi:MAG: hypothetical protein ACRERD_22625 [Candidatus Binatia bacterium]